MRGSAAIAAAAAAALAQDAPAQDAPPPVERPAYRLLRQDEDWSSLRGAEAASLTDPFDRIKYLPLSEDGEIWASFGGHARVRFEGWSGFELDPGDDGAFVLWRLHLHGDLHLVEHVRLFAEGKSALSSDRDLAGGTRALDADTLDLEQAFADLRLALGESASLTLRPGRQAFAFGKQRLVSPLPWANTMRRWDGVSATLRCGDWSVQGFWSQFVPAVKYDFNEADGQTAFFGVYATGKLPAGGPGLDLYVLGLDKDDAIAFNGTSGAEERITLGGRVFGSIEASGLDYDLEGSYQLGEVGAGDVSAFMVAAEAGWRAPELWGQPRFFAGFDYASGDGSAGGDVETFNQLFPLGHAFLGYADFVGRQNVIAATLGASLEPLEEITLRAAGHLFWRAETADALYNAGGGVVRGGGLGASREIGQEIDLTLTWRLDRHLAAELGYSHVFAGDFIDESGPSGDADFVYVQLQYTF